MSDPDSDDLRIRTAGPRLTLSQAGWIELTSVLNASSVLANAFRLLKDADLLISHDAFASAVALSFIGIEEVGKCLLERWCRESPNFQYDARRFHQSKQSAVAALLFSERARRAGRDAKFDFDVTLTFDRLVELATIIGDGTVAEQNFADMIRRKIVETAKWSGMYYDRDLASKGIEPAKITRAQAQSVLELLSRSFMSLADELNVEMAKIVFAAWWVSAKKESGVAQ